MLQPKKLSTLVVRKLDNIDELIDNHPTIIKIKKRSKVLKKELQYKEKPLSILLDLAATEAHYKNWHEAHTAIKNIYQSKKYSIHQLYGVGLKPPLEMKTTIHLGYNPKINMNLWNSDKNLLDNITIIGEDTERQKVGLYILKQALHNRYSLTLLDTNNSPLFEDIETYIKEENITNKIYKLNLLSYDNYIKSPHKTIIDEHTNNFLKGYIEQNLSQLFKTTYEKEIIQDQVINQNKKQLWHDLIIYFFMIANMAKKKENETPYYDFLHSKIELKNMIDIYENELLLNGHYNVSSPQAHNCLGNYLSCLPTINYLDKDTILEHNKYALLFTKFINTIQKNLHCFIEGEECFDLNFKEDYIYLINLDQNLNNKQSLIPHLFMNSMVMHSSNNNIINTINMDILNKPSKPITKNNMIYINNWQLEKDLYKRLSSFRKNNIAVIFSYNESHINESNNVSVLYSGQYLQCYSKREIMNDITQQKFSKQYFEENSYITYCYYNDTNHISVEHNILIDFINYPLKKIIKNCYSMK